MKGLLKNNFYATLSSAKAFAAVMALLGIFAAAMDNRIPSLIIGYMLLAMVGFSFISVAGIGRENTTKWGKYKLAAPVTRPAIVKSYFAIHLLWLLVGGAFAGTGVALSVVLHGYPFDKDTDIFMLFVVGIGISLFMGAAFFPLFFWGGEERSEVFSIISLLFSAGMVMGLTTLLKMLFPSELTTWQAVLGGMVILACAAAAFAFSYPLAVRVFGKEHPA